jgi:hypothetical protein
LRALLEEIRTERMSLSGTRMERGKVLEAYALTLGAAWARSLSEAVLREQRVVAGGFPGTIPEARWRVARYLGAELARLELSPLLPDEVSCAVEAAYARARREWLQLARGRSSPADASVAKRRATTSIELVAISSPGVNEPNGSGEP